MSQYANSFSTVYMSGTFNGWSGTGNPLTDQGNGLWSATIALPENDSLEYKFTIDDWAVQENFAGGESCTKTTGAFTNRFLAYGNMNMTLDTVCWSSCMACPALPPDSVNVTFLVDMGAADSIASDGIFIAGSFTGWSDVTMTDMDGDSTYEVTLALAEMSSYEFKFKNGANGWESIDLSWDSTCVVPGGFGNRSLVVDTSDITLPEYCFNTCVACDIVLPTTSVTRNAEFKLMPNPANAYVQLVFDDEFANTERTIFVQNAMGQLISNDLINNANTYNLNTSNLPNGIYFITVQTTEGMLTKKLVIRH